MFSIQYTSFLQQRKIKVIVQNEKSDSLKSRITWISFGTFESAIILKLQDVAVSVDSSR